MTRREDNFLRTDEEVRVADLMGRVYRDGGKFVVSPDGSRLGLRDTKRRDLHEQVKENRRAILEVLTGDPLEGDNIGWGVRSIFYSRMIDHVEATVSKLPHPAEQRAEKALFNSEWMKDLSRIHLNGSFTEYRAELLDLAGRVVRYAKSGEEEAPAFVAR